MLLYVAESLVICALVRIVFMWPSSIDNHDPRSVTDVFLSGLGSLFGGEEISGM